MGCGSPDESSSMLPALVNEMEKRGHVLEYTTYSVAAAIEVIMSVRMAEDSRLGKKAQKKLVVHRTPADIDDLLP